MTELGEAIGQRLDEVMKTLADLHRIDASDSPSPCLMVVSKTRSADQVREAISAGVRELGENRVPEAAAKKAELGELGQSVRWHLIGPLQRNKARLALETFDCIHSLDRPSLADRLQKLATELDLRVEVLIQVDFSGQPDRAGCNEDDLEELARRVLDHDRLELVGLMTLPPVDAQAEAARPYFRRLASLRELLADELGISLPMLSMGMSSDYRVALEEGSTCVRLGTAIFGPRQ